MTRRLMFNCKNVKEISQGSVFNAAYCEGYESEEVLGLVITARCDIANENKVKTYSYIPAIPFKSWKEVELIDVLRKKVLKGINKKVENGLKQAKLTLIHLDIYGKEKVIKTIKEKKLLKKDKDIESLEKNLSSYFLIKDGGDFNELIKVFECEIKSIIKDISEGKDASYFLIDNIEGYGSVVVNLRDVYKLDRETAKKVLGGIEINETLDDNIYRAINKNIIGTCVCLIGALDSPYIELLMQRFTNNFSRIGVENPNANLSDSIIMECQ
ncbi:hypothetical protein [Photobacterium leiognathi]|uniref:hypothetical protein n=1 Tax=Photobacterium leiognathi TaxID=553611 RepID=UPI002981BCE6|nr:hypothetical protein [Photobacterium leiognathi]